MPPSLIQDDIEQLLKIKTESKNLDYKEFLNWDTCEKDAKVELAKDVLAMANTQDGGRILLGVRDGDFDLVGLSEEEYISFDQTNVNDFLQKYTDPKFACHVCKAVVQGKRIVVIDVPEFTEIPILCKSDANSSKDGRLLLRRGQLYIRTDKGSSEAVSSAQEMREILGRALAKTGDALLANIERLIKGRPATVAEDAVNRYREEVDEAEGFIDKTIGVDLKTYGSWKVCAYPVAYRPTRVADQKTIKEAIDKSEVDLRGWNFPHTDGDNAANFLKGRQSFTRWERHVEAYRAYQSGLFIWTTALWEDVAGKNADGKPVLSFINAIWSLTEFLLFTKRYYELIAPDADLHVEITLNGTGGRELVSLQPGVSLYRGHISQEDCVVLDEDLQSVTLRASFREIANALARQLFAIFNWDDASETMIGNWQAKLLERRF